MAVNDFKPFAIGVGANVITQAEYETLVTILANGFTAGTADSNKLNKVWRQSAIMSAVLAQLIVDQTAQDAIDDGSTVTLLANLKAAVASLSAAPQLSSIDASIGGGALTLTVNPQTVTFRDSNLASGAISHVAIPVALTTVISNGSTGGSVSGALTRLYVAVINNAGVSEVAWINLAASADISETGLISTTAEGGTGNADIAGTWYSTNARLNVAYRVLGYVESTQVTAGQWATPPSKIQGVGGQSLSRVNSIGSDQTWFNYTGVKVSGTIYLNETPKPIVVAVAGPGTSVTFLQVSDTSPPALTVAYCGSNADAPSTMTTIVPSGWFYRASGAVVTWAELR